MSGGPGRNWYQVYLLVLTMVFVGGSWATGSEGQVIAATFPSWSRYLWYGGLLIGAVVALVGIAQHTVVGLLIERGALFWLSGLCAAYGCAFLAFAGRTDAFHAVFVVTFVLAFALVNLVRARQVRRDVDAMRTQLRRLATLETPA
jgi:hypothetical protein